MSKLAQLLSYLERPGMDELNFVSGSPATLHTGTRHVPLTVVPLREEQIRKFFAETPVAESFDVTEQTPAAIVMHWQGDSYRVTIERRSGILSIRVSRGLEASEPTAGDTPRPVSSSAASSAASPAASPARSARPTHKRPDTSSLRAALGRSTPSGDIRATQHSLQHPRRDIVVEPERERSPSLRLEPSVPAAVTGEDLRSSSPASRIPSQRALDAQLEHGFGSSVGTKTQVPSTRPPIDPIDPIDPIAAIDIGLAEADHEAPPLRRAKSFTSRDDPPESESPPEEFLLVGLDEVTFDSAYEPSPAVAAPSPSRASATPGEVAGASQHADVESSPTRSSHSTRHGLGTQTTDHGPSLADAATRPVSAPAELLVLLEDARARNATDVHIVADEPPRFRVAGALQPEGPRQTAKSVRGMLGPLLSPVQQQALAELGYVDLAIDLPSCGRLRVNVCRQRTGWKGCFRLLGAGPRSIEELGLPSEVRKLLTHHQGLVMLTGPNGHGKTTTMAAIVDLFNRERSMHIITVEDPVEIVHPRKKALVTQREVGRHTRSFRTALAAALREDPDVISIGELRDRETVEMALAAAETGHLVLATMSTPSGSKTIDRLIDMFPPDDQAQVRATLAGALKLILSQRLLRRSDGHGVVAAFEMITGSIPLWALIRDSKLFQLPSLMQRGRNFGMLRLDESLKSMVERGVVHLEEARRFAEDPRVLEDLGR